MKRPPYFYVALLSATSSLSLSAAPLYWDLTPDSPGAGTSPSGNWSSIDANWNTNADGTGLTDIWNPDLATENTAIFAAGTDALEPYTVTISGTQNALGITIQEGTVIFAGGKAEVGAIVGTETVPGVLAINSGATLSIDSALRLGGKAGSKVLLDGGTLIQTIKDNAVAFIPSALTLEVGPNGGTVNYTSSGAGLVSTYAGTITGTGTLTKTGPGEFRYQGTGLPNTTFSKLVVKEGLYRLGFNSSVSDERGFGAVPATFTPDAITLSNGGSIATSFTAANSVLHANRGITLGEGGGAIVSHMTVPGAISGIGSLTVRSGTINLNGVNTYSGGTIVNSGTLNATGTSALGASTGPLSVNNLNSTAAGNTVAVNLSTTAPTTVGSLSGIVAIPTSGTNTARINNGGQLFTVNQTVAGTFEGTITGAGGFTLGNLSTQSLTLTGASTFSGELTVAGGSLIATGSGVSLGTGNVTVQSTAVKLTIQTGVLNAINNTAILTLAGGGTSGLADFGFIELGAGIDESVGGLVLGGMVQEMGTYGSTASNATFKNDEYFSGTGIVRVVPEPGAVTTLFGGLGMLIGLQRFRRRD